MHWVLQNERLRSSTEHRVKDGFDITVATEMYGDSFAHEWFKRLYPRVSNICMMPKSGEPVTVFDARVRKVQLLRCLKRRWSLTCADIKVKHQPLSHGGIIVGTAHGCNSVARREWHWSPEIMRPKWIWGWPLVHRSSSILKFGLKNIIRMHVLVAPFVRRKMHGGVITLDELALGENLSR